MFFPCILFIDRLYNPVERIFQVLEELKSHKKTRILRKMTKQRIKNIGLYYLKRFESSVDNLRTVLKRRVDAYAYHDKAFDRNEAYAWIEEVVEDFERYGYLNDERYAEMKIKSYMSAGKSPRYIFGKLREKGVDEGIINGLMDVQDYDPLEAALKLAKKKKIGPFCEDETMRLERRSKDLAILVRAGFDYDTAVRVLSSSVFNT